MNRHLLTISFLIAILALSSFVSMESEEVDAVGVPAIMITLDQSKLYANITANSGDVVTFTGEVEVAVPWSPDIQTLVVQLEGDAGTFETTDMPEMVFTNEITILPFECSVELPPRASADQAHELAISGEWRYVPGSMGGRIDPATAYVDVSPYYEYDVFPSCAECQMERMKSYDYFFMVTNDGNCDDIIVLEIMNQEDLKDDGIVIEVLEDDMNVPYQYFVEYPLLVMIDRDTRLGEYEIEARVHSSEARSSGEPYEYEETTGIIEVVEEMIPPEIPEEPPEDPPEGPPEDPPEDPPEEPVDDPVEEPDDIDSNPDDGNISPKDESPPEITSSAGRGFEFTWLVIVLIVFVILSGFVFFVVRMSQRS